MTRIASVIITCYQKITYLYKAIDSVLQQNYSGIELLIADDGSDYFPQLEIENYIKKNKKSNILSVSVYSNPENFGTVKNLNTAIKKSTGDFIINLASDDMFFNCDVLNNVVRRLKNSKSGVVTFRRILCDEKMNGIRYMPTDDHIKTINQLTTPQKQHSAFIRAEYYEMASGSSTYYTRDRLFSDGLYDETFRLLEDWTYFIRVTRKDVIETAYDIVSIYYRTGGISSSMSPAIKKDILTILTEELRISKKRVSLFDYRYLNYNYIRYSKGYNLIPSILYPDSFISRLVYRLKCNRYERKGKKNFQLGL